MIKAEELKIGVAFIKKYLWRAPMYLKKTADYSDLCMETLLLIYEKGIVEYSKEEFRINFLKVWKKHKEYILASNPGIRRSIEGAKEKYRLENKEEINRRHKENLIKPIKISCEGRTISRCYYPPIGGKPIYYFK